MDLSTQELRRLAAVLRRTRGWGRRLAEGYVAGAPAEAIERLERAARALEDIDELRGLDLGELAGEPIDPLRRPPAIN